MSSAPPSPPVKPPVDPNVQAVRNMQLLARQAIANGFDTMSVNPRMVADAAVAFDSVLSGATPDARLDTVSSKLRAAEANVASMQAQVEKRYSDGMKDGAAACEPLADQLAFKAAIIARENPALSAQECVQQARAKLAAGG